MDHKGIYLQSMITKRLSRTYATADAIAYASNELPLARKAGRRTRRTDRWPDFSALDLSNPNDLFTAHQLLIGEGIASDDYDSLYAIVLAAVLASRLARSNPAGYFVTMLRRGLWHPVTDRDHVRAKAIIRTIDAT